MTDREDNIQDMFIRTAQFDTENANDYRDLADAVANFLIVRDVIAAIEAYSAAQLSGARGRAVEQKFVINAAIRRKLLRYSKTARAMDIDDPGFRRLFSVSDDDSYALTLATARIFLIEARRFETEFRGRGIPPTVADALEADINAMETAMNDKAAGQMETVGATAGIGDEIERGMKAVKILDSIMHNVYYDNPVKLAEWRTARHVKAAPKKQEPKPPTS